MRFALGAYQARVDERVATLVADDAAARIWRRDATFWGGDESRERSVANRLGWLDVASQMRHRLDEIAAFTGKVRAGGFADAVLLGMGGNSLATEVLRQSIAQSVGAGWPRLHVLDTTDPAAILAVSEAIDPVRTLFFVSSKSGTTIEALSLFAHFHALVEKGKASRAGDNFVAVTDADTPLQELARQYNFFHVFTNPGDIGGRYSALSYFGLAPAAAAGVDVGVLLDRGVAAASGARASTSEALRLGAALGELALAGRDKCTFIVSASIASFGLWVEQLIAESTGKEGRGILPVASEPLGAPEAYAADRMFVQLRVQGEDSGMEDALVAALSADGHPAITIELEDAYDLGRDFFTWEFAVAIAGQVLGINPFDEPNVQESKDNTSHVLKEFEASGQLDAPSLDEDHVSAFVAGGGGVALRPMPAALESLLSGIDDDGYFAITAYVRPSRYAQQALDAVRTAVRDGRHVATTLGCGPRFLHSTGQLHKGGPPKGVFLQLTASDERDLAIPGTAFTFGQLKRAQSIGDFQSLAAHGRPVVRVHLGRDIEGGLSELTTGVRSAAQASAWTGR